MKEIREIIAAYDDAVAANKKCALATVVHVEGSSYRRPGARMLVTEDGMITGAISGGCLEGDALRKALHAIHQNKNKLVTYDTSGDDSAFGVQLGCNGIVHILFEPLNSAAPNAILLLKKINAERKASVIVTLFNLDREKEQPGTIMCSADDHVGNIDERVLADMRAALANGVSEVKDYGGFKASFQLIKPSFSLVIVGAGNDVIPLAAIADVQGWNITVVDGRPTHANVRRFPMADAVYVVKAPDIAGKIEIDELTAIVLMTHNYVYDITALEKLLSTACRYIGILGPRQKLERMLDELASKGRKVTEEELSRIYSPVGLDLAAETAEEIALSVAAEIKAVLSGASAEMLRERQGSIHKRTDQLTGAF